MQARVSENEVQNIKVQRLEGGAFADRDSVSESVVVSTRPSVRRLLFTFILLAIGPYKASRGK